MNVTSCESCPFCHETEGLYKIPGFVCRAGNVRPDWKKIPDACPLRKGPVTVSLGTATWVVGVHAQIGKYGAFFAKSYGPTAFVYQNGLSFEAAWIKLFGPLTPEAQYALDVALENAARFAHAQRNACRVPHVPGALERWWRDHRPREMGDWREREEVERLHNVVEKLRSEFTPANEYLSPWAG